jgi:phospholipase C
VADLKSIEHVVIVMLENRSFDHMLGWMSLPAYGRRKDVDGLVGDLDPLAGEVANTDYDNYALGHRWRPFVATADAPLVTDLPHSRAEVANQLDWNTAIGGFSMTGFARSYFESFPGNRAGRPESMLVFPPQLVPTTAFLARTFTVCDHWFCSVPADTQPNRFMSLAGYTQRDDTPPNPPDHQILTDWCAKQGVRWRVYHEGFAFETLFRKSVLLDPNYVGFDGLADDFQTEGDDTFPQVILVEPQFDDDPFAQHPDDNHPPLPVGPGEVFLSRVYKAVTSNAKRWAKTLMLVYYDEHGGFFDHVPPLGVRTEAPNGQYPAFETTGPRVPAIVVSPYARAGGVCKAPLDHTSLLRFLGERFAKDGKYSDIVSARHASGLLKSLSEALDLSSVAIPTPPAPPVLGMVASVTYGEPRQPVTPLQQAFARARAEAHSEQADAVANKHPQMLFDRPHPATGEPADSAPRPRRQALVALAGAPQQGKAARVRAAVPKAAAPKTPGKASGKKPGKRTG